MNCQFRYTTIRPTKDGMETVYHCRMGIPTGQIPEYCNTCSYRDDFDGDDSGN